MVIALIIVSVLMSSVAQILLKSGMSSEGVRSALAMGDRVDIALAIGLNPMVVAGLVTYVLGAIVWLFVLTRIEVSIAYPFVALGFVFTAAFASLFLGEYFSMPKIVGTSLIIAGVIILARGTPLVQH